MKRIILFEKKHVPNIEINTLYWNYHITGKTIVDTFFINEHILCNFSITFANEIYNITYLYI